MNAHLLLFAEMLISIAVSIAVLLALSRPLVHVLARICPDEQAATFWQSYTKVMLLIAPLLFVLVADMLTHFRDPADTLRVALIAALGGTLIGLRSIGKRLGQFVALPRQKGDAS